MAYKFEDFSDDAMKERNRQIHALRQAGYTLSEIAERCQVSQGRAQQIASRMAGNPRRPKVTLGNVRWGSGHLGYKGFVVRRADNRHRAALVRYSDTWGWSCTTCPSCDMYSRPKKLCTHILHVQAWWDRVVAYHASGCCSGTSGAPITPTCRAIGCAPVVAACDAVSDGALPGLASSIDPNIPVLSEEELLRRAFGR